MTTKNQQIIKSENEYIKQEPIGKWHEEINITRTNIQTTDNVISTKQNRLTMKQEINTTNVVTAQPPNEDTKRRKNGKPDMRYRENKETFGSPSPSPKSSKESLKINQSQVLPNLNLNTIQNDQINQINQQNQTNENVQKTTVKKEKQNEKQHVLLTTKGNIDRRTKIGKEFLKNHPEYDQNNQSKSTIKSNRSSIKPNTNDILNSHHSRSSHSHSHSEEHRHSYSSSRSEEHSSDFNKLHRETYKQTTHKQKDNLNEEDFSQFIAGVICILIVIIIGKIIF